MKKILTPLLTLIFTTALPLTAQDATALIERSEEAIRGNTMIATYEITVTTKRWTRTMTMKSWSNRTQKKTFAEITAPAKDAGTRFLLMNSSMWNYIPGLQRAIKVSPAQMTQSWMGSDFTNDDIVKESSLVNDYTHSLDGTATIDGHKCYRVVLTPKPEAAVVWGKIIYYLRVTDALPVKEEFYNEHNVKKKELAFSEFKNMGGRHIPTLYVMRTMEKPERSTKMRIIDVSFNSPIPSHYFTLQHLKRR